MSSDVAARPWVVRADAPTVLLVPRSEPLPTRDDVDAAYERGLADGRRAAEAEREHAVVALTESVAAAERAIAGGIERARATTVTLAIDLAVELARWLVDAAIVHDPDVLRARLDEALDAMADERGHRVVVAPAVADLVRGWLGPDATVETDVALAPGELRIEAGHASLDATYDAALARAREALLRSFEAFDLREPV